MNAGFLATLIIYLYPTVPERAWGDTALQAAPLLVDVTKMVTDRLSPLKAVLGVISAIYTNCKVRLWFLLVTF